MPNAPTSPPAQRSSFPTGLAGLLVCLLGCSESVPSLPTWSVEMLENPSPAGAMAPSLSAAVGDVWLSWLAPLAVTPESPENNEPVWTVATARFDSTQFIDASEASRSGAMFANWADFPTTATAPSGAQYAHHLAKLGPATFAYGVFLQGRHDTTSPWTDLGLLHDDASETEHGFVSYAHHGDGLRAFWLDGRGMLAGGPMTLRTTMLPTLATPSTATDPDATDLATDETGTSEQPEDSPQPRFGPSSMLLDERVCECCQTDAATTNDGPIVAYRDRSLEEIRDIYVVRFEDDRWTAPMAVHEDGWEISGCPVNGPAIAAARDFVAVAWFTAADDEPRTRLAISQDGGRSFSRPVDLAGGRAGGTSLGRIDLVLRPGPVASDTDRGPVHDLWVAHFARAKGQDTNGPELLVEHLRFDGKLRRGSQTVITATSEARSAGFPRMVATNDGPLIAWVEAGDPSQVRTARLAAETKAP